MADLFTNPDGASHQARAVLAYLSYPNGIEESWNGQEYIARPKASRWENGKEQGYIVTLRSFDYQRQINIAFFEHRNSDAICAIEWEQCTANAPTIDTAEFGDVYSDKYGVSKSFKVGKAMEMSDWIYVKLESFWKETSAGKYPTYRREQ